MKRKVFLNIIVIFVLSMTAVAQTVREEIAANPQLSASNYLAYPSPTKALTAAPKGYKPFYLSHYGRHGSRYHIGTAVYDRPYRTLMKADSLGKLTPLGKDVLRRVTMMREESHLRDGELTELGAEQHQQIARRMWERFPQIFAGDVHIEARSTTIIRCILSMENELHQLLRLNPKLKIFHDASVHDMYYMNFDDTLLQKAAMPKEVREAYNAFTGRHRVSMAHTRRLFNDTAYNSEAQLSLLDSQLFLLASNLQSSELRHRITLYDLFSVEDLYQYWLRNNAWWLINYGFYTLNGAKQPYIERNLLRDIIEKADSCIQLKRPGATLRFGHETCVLPLVCLLELNGYGQPVADLEQAEEKGWINYRVFPMGANVQFVFYRKGTSGKDILVKVLLNEQEATLPISGNAPYYRWDDVRKYYLDKLEAYERSVANP